MTERQGLFPPAGTEDGTGHWIIDRNGVTGLFRWGAGLWSLPHYRGALQPITLRNCQYLGPAPTYEQAQADAADARRFRFLLSMWWKGDALRDFFHTNVEDDRIIAAIDAEMGEDSNA